MAQILLRLTRIITWIAECTIWHTCSGLVWAFLSWKFKEDLHEVKVSQMGRVSYSKPGFLLSHFTRVKFFLNSMRNKIQITRETRNKINERDTCYRHYTWVAQRIALYANWISAMDIVLINSSSIKMSSYNFYVKTKENCFLGCTNIWKTIKLVQKIMQKSKNNFTQIGGFQLIQLVKSLMVE